MSGAAFEIVQDAGGLVTKLVRRGVAWWLRHAMRQRVLGAGLVVAVVWLASFNIAANPRIWSDEGGALDIARTLTTDGVYAVRSTEGYHSYGAVQSIGPTVVLPVALSFKLFGVGLIQARLIAIAYLLLATFLIYRVGGVLFDRRTALLAVALLLGAPAAQFLHFGRQVLGEVPATAFLLGGWLAWAHGVRTGRRWLSPLTGLLLGAAMVTKPQFILFGFGALLLIALLDWFFYRQRVVQGIIVAGAVAGACVALWWGWQFAYFGPATFFANVTKLRELSAVSNGFSLQTSSQGISWLLGRDSGNFYYFLGLPALLYGVFLSLRRTREGLLLAFLLLFTLLAWAYWLFWFIPIVQYAVTPAVLSVLFVAKFGHDLTQRATLAPQALWAEFRSGRPGRTTMSLLGVFMLGLMIFAPLKVAVRTDVMDQHREAQAVATFLNTSVPPAAVVETWYPEIAILTNHRYHFPDYELLAPVEAAYWRGQPRNYLLGADYFNTYRPDYLVVGWLDGTYDVYDDTFVAQHSRLIATIGDFRVYQLLLPAP